MDIKNIDLMGALADHLVDEATRRVLDGIRQSAVSAVEPYIGADAAAEYLGCSARRIYDLKKERTLRVVKDGNRLLTKIFWIDEYLDRENWS